MLGTSPKEAGIQLANVHISLFGTSMSLCLLMIHGSVGRVR